MNMNINKAATRHDEEVVRFSDQTPDWVYSVPSNMDPTFGLTDTTDASLEGFFKRPVRIQAFQWLIGTPAYQYFDPWGDYFHNLRVVNRINNYNLIRAKLHLKIVLNGNGFYSGRLMVSYNPRPFEMNGIGAPRQFFNQDMIQMSQLPHVMLDPTTSQGGELVLPFFHQNSNLSIPADNFLSMGVIHIKELNPLQHANGATESITVTVYAWAEDVVLSIPTSTRNGSILPQMGDEYGLKPVSKAAATVARAAGALSSIPAIAPYAKATAEAAKSVGNIASIFGYSRPATLAEPNFIVPQHVGTLANTNLPEAVTKLTLDAKQEVTIDPRVVGLGNADEMSILSIAKRESYLTSWEWTTAQPLDTVLGSLVVSPMAFFVQNRERTLTPLAFATLPFKYWRGTIKFRFQVVASAFHKGRLRAIYDPYILQGASVGEYNVNYSYVVDIADEKDFTLAIGWGQPLNWRQTTDLTTTAYPSGLYNTIIPATADSLNSNGCLTLVVVNDLTVPNNVDPHPIQVNVFVSAGDDFEVCVPYCRNIADLSFADYNTNPSGIVEPPDKTEEEFVAQMGDTADPVDDVNEDIPVSSEIQHTLAPSLPLSDHVLDVFFGDPVVSFRQCLKRYNYAISWPIAAGTFRYASFYLPDIPFFRGCVPGAIGQAISPVGVVNLKYNWSNMTLLNYLLPAYAGRRGGIRWKYQYGGRQPAGCYMSVTKADDGVGYSSLQSNWGDPTLATPNARAHQSISRLPHTWCATHVVSHAQNPSLEVELPYYPNRRYYPTRNIDVTTAGNTGTAYHRLVVTTQVPTGEVCDINAYVSVAEDFNLFFFCYVPQLYVIPTPVPLA